MTSRRWLTLVAMVALLAAGMVGQGRSQTVDAVRLQLKWLTQAQFAGYYAARAKGFYAAENLDVTIQPGGPAIVPEQVVAAGGAQFGIDWLPSLLAVRDRGIALVNIAQVFAHSGMREIAFKSSGIRGAADLRGRKVAVWFAGNEFELLATLEKYGIDRRRDVTLVPQPLDMSLLLDKKVDAAAAMTYNEYHQVLDAGVKPEDLIVIDFNREGTAMLQDGIFAASEWLRDPKNKQIAARFLRASLKGWEFCRQAADQCVDLVLHESPALRREHQTRMLVEVTKLIWGPPTPRTPLGKMDREAFKRTAEIAFRFGVITKPADSGAYTDEIWEMAQQGRRDQTGSGCLDSHQAPGKALKPAFKLVEAPTVADLDKAFDALLSERVDAVLVAPQNWSYARPREIAEVVVSAPGSQLCSASRCRFAQAVSWRTRPTGWTCHAGRRTMWPASSRGRGQATCPLSSPRRSSYSST